MLELKRVCLLALLYAFMHDECTQPTFSEIVFTIAPLYREPNQYSKAWGNTHVVNFF